MIQDKDIAYIGYIQRTHGKSGELQCMLENDIWESVDAEFVFIKINSIAVPWRIEQWRYKGNDSIIFQLKTLSSDQQATPLINCPVYISRTDIQTDEHNDDTMLWSDLIGYKVWDTEQGCIGQVADIDQTTVNTLLLLNNGKMLPAHEDLIISIDPQSKRITMNLPLGL